jgi:hypothetical protein
VRRVVSTALVVTGTVLVLDGSWWFATGDYLIPEP